MFFFFRILAFWRPCGIASRYAQIHPFSKTNAFAQKAWSLEGNATAASGTRTTAAWVLSALRFATWLARGMRPGRVGEEMRSRCSRSRRRLATRAIYRQSETRLILPSTRWSRVLDCSAWYFFSVVTVSPPHYFEKCQYCYNMVHFCYVVSIGRN